MTLGAFQAVQELKLRCPEEISLLGFDDFYWATLLQPRITMVRQPAPGNRDDRCKDADRAHRRPEPDEE